MCKPIKVGTPADDGFKIMEDIRVDKTMVDGKATFKTINIKETSSHNAKSLVPGGKLLNQPPMSSKTLALVLSDNTRNRDSNNFIYHFQNCTALTTQSSATFSGNGNPVYSWLSCCWR
jgi:hypothetical protein